MLRILWTLNNVKLMLNYENESNVTHISHTSVHLCQAFKYLVVLLIEKAKLSLALTMNTTHSKSLACGFF